MLPDILLPGELVTMIRNRRVIPFIGAGFSVGLNLPDWNSLLEEIAKEVEDGLTYDAVRSTCNSDPLQIAEYYFLKSDRSIGPIRFAISKALQNAGDPLQSGAHIELVNLGAPQVYTTNYDDLIETTFRSLNMPVEVIALPKHVATSSGSKTQVVKYHGDLRHEATLVLTESSYYARLDFESPMDLKFRSDLLGRSVLFIGYSFRDVNIRIIWFKLMRMMKDIRAEDRPSSFIVRFEPNPVLERLYEEVGIKTIALDPTGNATTPEQRTSLLEDFMLLLSSQASTDGRIPGYDGPQFVSKALIDNLSRSLGKPSKLRSSMLRRSLSTSSTVDRLLTLGANRTIPQNLAGNLAEIIERMSGEEHPGYQLSLVKFALQYVSQIEGTPAATLIVAEALGRRMARTLVLVPTTRWDRIWNTKLNDRQAKALIDAFSEELDLQENREPGDHDLAYLADPIARIAAEEIVESSQVDIIKKAKELLNLAASHVSSIADYEPIPAHAPKVNKIVEQLDELRPDEEPDPDEDIPF